MTDQPFRWTRKHTLIALAAMMAVQVCLIIHFRTGLLGNDDMTAAFSGKRFVSDFDMTIPLTNLPMSMRMGMCIPLGVLQLVMPTKTAMWVFPLLCAIPLVPLSYRIGRLLQLSRPLSFVAAAMISCTPAVIFNSSVALTEVPLLVVTLAALLCFLKGLPTRCETDEEQVADKQPLRWRYGWMLAAGMLTGVLFLIKVSAVTLIASLVVYAGLRQVCQRRLPWAAVVVGCGFAAILAAEMGVWTAMSGEPLYRFNRVRAAANNSQADMKEFYGQTTFGDILAKYRRYLPHFLGRQASFGNLFLPLFLGWGAACLFAKKYRLFLLIYAGPQLVYFWYLVTFYPSTQPRYAIQLLPFLVLGTLLLLERWSWSQSGKGLAVILLVVGLNLGIGMKARANQYHANNLFFVQYTHEKTQTDDAAVYVDGRSISIYHTLNNFEPSRVDTLWQYPVYLARKTGGRRSTGSQSGDYVFPWRETNLEETHGFVTIDLRLFDWTRRRLKCPPILDIPPANWVLVDSAFPRKVPTLGGLVYYASPHITAEPLNVDASIDWSAGKKWNRIHQNEEPVKVTDETIIFQKGDLLVLGDGAITSPALQFKPDQFDAEDNLYAFVEFDCTLKQTDAKQPIYLPVVRLFDGQEQAGSIRFPIATLTEGSHTLRFPLRLSSQLSGIRLSLQFQQDSEVSVSPPRYFVQRLGKDDRERISRYDRVEPELDDIVSLRK